MPIHLACPACGAKGTLPDAAAGKSARCPRCRALLVIPILTPPPAPVPAAPPPAPEDDLEFDPTAPAGGRSRGFNPFADGAADAPPETEAERAKGRRKYAAEAHNPFAGAPAAAEAPADDPFDYSPPDAPGGPAPGAFDFGPADAFADEFTAKKKGDPRRKRR